MSENVTLTAGMRSNLTGLQSTLNLMNRTQDRLATGKKVNSALDNPTNYFAAQTHLNRASDLASRKDGMSEAVQTAKAADAGIKAITSLIEAAKGLASSALGSTTTADRTAYSTQYNTLRSQIDTLAANSGYKGTNLINANNLKVEFNEIAGASTLTMTGFTATSAGLTINSAAWVFGSDTAITNSAAELDGALSTLRAQSSQLAANLTVVTTRQDFTNSMINTLQTGADNLTLADMNEEGANMLMLQTRQSLSTTALSLSSQAAQSILKLF